MTAREDAAAAHKVMDPLVRLYQDAQQRITAEMERLAGDPQRTARLARLHELQAAVVAEMDRLDESAAVFMQTYGARPYLDGVRATGGAFTAVNREAARRLADDTFDDLLTATQYVRADTRRFIQAAGKVAAESTVLGQTAPQAGRQMMRDLIDNHGIKAVTYRNGAKHPLGDYSDMLIRTKTATHFVEGSLDGAPEVTWWEIFDGPSCGFSSHDDIRLANGLIVTRAEVRAYPISHPRCRRAAGPRPDILSKTAAKKKTARKVDRQAAALA
jgi:hypothetical protein